MVTVGHCALGTVNLVVTQGADNEFAFRYSRRVGETVTPVDLTGYSARAQLRRAVGRDVWLDMTDQDRISLDDEGWVKVSIPAVVTEPVEWNRYSKLVDGKPVPTGVWDLELVDPDGGVVRFVEGTVTVCPDVTRND